MNPNLLGMFTEVIKQGSRMVDGTLDFVQKKLDYDKTDVDNKVKAIMDLVDSEGNKVYPNANKDLLSHYFATENLSDNVGTPLALAIGFGKEIGDSQRVPYFNPEEGYFEGSTGFSVDDLGANVAGGTGMSFDEAYQRGLFTHTETVPQNQDWSKSSQYGYGQGKLGEVINKFSD